MNQRLAKSTSLRLHTAEISNYLTGLADTIIPVPGQIGEQKVTIHKMHKNVYTMITKTRPKKIGFIGSDGKE